MHCHHLKPLLPVVSLAVKRGQPPGRNQRPHAPNGEVDMEPRVIELEAHLEYLQRDMQEIRSDVKSIKHRLAYSAAGTAIVLGLLGWIANSRFDQLVSLLLAH